MMRFLSPLAWLAASVLSMAALEPGRAQTPGDFTLTWSKGVVWYQIFPERFRNGDPHNDPKAIDQRGAYPFNDSSAFQIHPWGSDWYQLQPYELQNGQNVGYNIQRRRYGGDLQGVLDKLNYLQQLGVNALYLTPFFGRHPRTSTTPCATIT